MKTIVVSDLHIGSRYFCRDLFREFLRHFPQDCDLVLNGDIIDRPLPQMAVEDRHILDRIKQLACERSIVWIRGNHDNGFAPQSFGRIRSKSYHILDNLILAAHGDQFDGVMPHSRLFMTAFKLLHRLRIKLGAKPVHVAEYAKSWQFFYQVLRRNVMMNAVNFAASKGIHTVTCGHTHFAEDQVINGIRYINTGAWTELPAHFLLIEDRHIALRKIEGRCARQAAVISPSAALGN
jgi:UDP-2,3-diacylglucosamine pyrophosphatase LpxH